MTRNFQTTHPHTPRSRLQIAVSLTLSQHPKWTEFIYILSQAILTRHPDFRQPLLELLDQADLL